jgi:hypothetical protein
MSGGAALPDVAADVGIRADSLTTGGGGLALMEKIGGWGISGTAGMPGDVEGAGAVDDGDGIRAVSLCGGAVDVIKAVSVTGGGGGAADEAGGGVDVLAGGGGSLLGVTSGAGATSVELGGDATSLVGTVGGTKTVGVKRTLLVIRGVTMTDMVWVVIVIIVTAGPHDGLAGAEVAGGVDEGGGAADDGGGGGGGGGGGVGVTVVLLNIGSFCGSRRAMGLPSLFTMSVIVIALAVMVAVMVAVLVTMVVFGVHTAWESTPLLTSEMTAR